MKIPQNLPRFSDYTREEALRLLLEKEYGCPPPQPDTLEFHVVRREEDAFAGEGRPRHGRGLGHLPGEGLFFPLPPGVPQGRPACAWGGASQLHPCCAGLLPALRGVVRLGIGGGLLPLRGRLPGQRGFHLQSRGLFQVDRSLPTAPGKLALWAWGASVVREYLAACPEIDQRAVAVAGHSRLGKTALLARRLDKRFQFVFANESGCSGAALYRGKQGETAADIQRVFPYWFSPSFASCTGDPEQLPFDQHFLLSLIAPRKLYVSSAAEDLWSDPAAEFLGCLAASPAFEAAGVPGLVGAGEEPQLDQACHQGNIGYHLRAGKHFLSREDWRQFAAYLFLHREK